MMTISYISNDACHNYNGKMILIYRLLYKHLIFLEEVINTFYVYKHKFAEALHKYIKYLK